MNKLIMALLSGVIALVVGLSPVDSEAASYFTATSEYGEFQIAVYPSHVEVTDQAGNTLFLSATADGIVQVESFPISGGYSSTVYDVANLTVTPQEQAAYDELMAGITVTASGSNDPGGVIVQGQSGRTPLMANGDASIQSWGCFSAVLKLAAAAVAVGLACSGPQAALACAAALMAYLAASIDYWNECGYIQVQ